MTNNPIGPWTLSVHNLTYSMCYQYTFSRFGEASGSFLAKKLHDDEKHIESGLSIIYSDDSFMKEAGEAIAGAVNVTCVRLRFDPTYYIDRSMYIPSHQFFKEFISQIVRSPTLKKLHLQIPYLCPRDEAHAVSAFEGCRLSDLSIEAPMSKVFWARMVDMSRCHVGGMKVESGYCPAAYLKAINQNLEGRFEMWTITECLKKNSALSSDANRIPHHVGYHKDSHERACMSMTLHYSAMFSLDLIPAAHMGIRLACAAERMLIKMVNYLDHDRTLIMRSCELTKGRLPDLTLFGDGLRRLRVIDCGLIG